ncbi:hypothetical protein [Pseudidiomarina taiwanensis]|uniref:YtkA-like domain-containing protein n=1 Tax=Pseudidiomarina taiwanensis TaxID=337250 RepID=A0A432ZND4_9GAMM|nr:hypothetical protein [Pseudidiomarina taiwanensis]RUO79371.1 hypothetical protein CWI83_02360 [Pseudidiomarina taiwanensis]
MLICRTYAAVAGVFLLLLTTGCDAPSTVTEFQQLDLQLVTDRPQVEEPLEFTLKLPLQQQPQLSFIEGINMNMGRLPVRWEHRGDGIWHGQSMVGACTEPMMQWRLVVIVQTPKGQIRDELLFQTRTN